jgi:hypothetical protein
MFILGCSHGVLLSYKEKIGTIFCISRGSRKKNLIRLMGGVLLLQEIFPAGEHGIGKCGPPLPAKIATLLASEMQKQRVEVHPCT